MTEQTDNGITRHLRNLLRTFRPTANKLGFTFMVISGIALLLFLGWLIQPCYGCFPLTFLFFGFVVEPAVKFFGGGYAGVFIVAACAVAFIYILVCLRLEPLEIKPGVRLSFRHGLVVLVALIWLGPAVLPLVRGALFTAFAPAPESCTEADAAALLSPGQPYAGPTLIAFIRRWEENYKIFLIHPDGSGLRPLTKNEGYVQENHFLWSPDGQKILFNGCYHPDCASQDPYVFDLRTGRTCAVYIDKTNIHPRVSLPNLNTLAWGADSAHILYEILEKDKDSSKKVIYLQLADGSDRTVWPESEIDLSALTLDRAGNTTWSPDGTQLVLSDSGDGGPTVLLADAAGTQLRPVLPGRTYDPAWSPDSRQLVLLNDNGPYIVNTDGTGSRLLTGEVESFGLPQWSPDGRTLLFESLVNGYPEIYRIDVDGTNLVRLTHGAGGSKEASWSPDGKKIIFVSGKWGDEQLYIMNADGSDPTRLSFGPGRIDDPQWQP